MAGHGTGLTTLVVGLVTYGVMSTHAMLGPVPPPGIAVVASAKVRKKIFPLGPHALTEAMTGGACPWAIRPLRKTDLTHMGHKCAEICTNVV